MIPRVTPWLAPVARGLTLLFPIVLLHGRGVADITLSLVAILFLAHSALARDWSWLRRLWVRLALAWWAWLVICSLRWGAAPGALVTVRFLVFTAALETWVLREAWMRDWLQRLLRWAAFYLAAQCLLQFVTGRNLYGWPRAPDGELTGPYDKPRTGPILARLLFPALLPLAATPLRALLWLIAGVTLMVLIGQRMPLLLTFLGLFTTALFLKQLRMPVLYTAVTAGLLLALLPQVSPEAAHRIETKFAAQMSDFSRNHYGLIAARSIAMVQSDPLMGVGFDGFRRLCDEPRFFHGWHGGDGGGAMICVQHPHSYYLQALVEGGIPGLLLFAGTAVAWLVAIGRGLFRAPDPFRVGLFVAALVQLWPIAGSSDWVAMPLSGWFFVQLGLALALASPYMPGPRQPLEG